ncbi:MAG TPA: hypothetical protein ENH23_05795, partial [candidate division Zixibacteria bacterium]|nr:hypothetical protein [candidate division Zixibacteria bacterium]
MENFDNIQQQEENIDVKTLYYKLSRHWFLFGVSILIAITIAFLYNKNTNPEYEVHSTVLVNDSKSKMDPSALLGIGFANDKQNLENEIGKLSSFSLAYQSVQKLPFQVSYFGENSLMKSIQKLHIDASYFERKQMMATELYRTAPFEIVYDTTVPQAVGLRYYLKFLNKNEYEIEAEGEHIYKYNYSTKRFVKGEIEKVIYKGKFRFGQEVKSKYNTFKVLLNRNFNPEKDFGRLYQFLFNDYISLTKHYMAIKIEPINREASILKLTLKSSSLPKAVDYLNMMTQQYLDRNLEMKNRIAENTIKFINGQLSIISDTLSSAEMNLQRFRSKKEVMDISFQSQQVFQYMGDMEKQRAELLVKSQYYNNLKDYIKKNETNLNNLVAPSAMGIEDPALNALVAQLIELFNKKAEVLLYSTEKSPSVITINSQILSTKRAIAENVTNIIKNSNEAIADINRQIRKISLRLNELPVTQRQLFNFERKFKLADNIYTFLLEKRSDAQITKASNMPDNQIIDKARTDFSNVPVFPKKSMNYLIALILGIAFPLAYVFGKDYMNDKIVERKDVEKNTKFPIIGQLLHSNKDTQLVVAHYPKSSISEYFRSLRTNIQYLVRSK